MKTATLHFYPSLRPLVLSLGPPILNFLTHQLKWLFQRSLQMVSGRNAWSSKTCHPPNQMLFNLRLLHDFLDFAEWQITSKAIISNIYGYELYLHKKLICIRLGGPQMDRKVIAPSTHTHISCPFLCQDLYALQSFRLLSHGGIENTPSNDDLEDWRAL